MGDQASQLRNLVLRATRQREAETNASPYTVAVIGGARGVGTTSVAVELAAALVEHGSRVVLVDLDPHHAQLAEASGITLPADYEPAIARRDIHAALQRGPFGVQLVPGVWDNLPVDATALEIGWPQLARQFQQLERHTDILLLDCGNSPLNFLREVGNFSDLAIFVSSPLANIVTRTYTLLKGCVSAGVHSAPHLLINQARDAHEAEGVIQRFERSCRRFLGLSLNSSSHWLQASSTHERREQLEELATRCTAGVADKRMPKRLLAAK